MLKVLSFPSQMLKMLGGGFPSQNSPRHLPEPKLSTTHKQPLVAANFDVQSAQSRRHGLSRLSEHPAMLICTPGSTRHPKVVSNGRPLYRLVAFLAFPKTRKTPKVGSLWIFVCLVKIGQRCTHWSSMHPVGPAKKCIRAPISPTPLS